jgi:transposase
MKQQSSWEIIDTSWKVVEPLVPKQECNRNKILPKIGKSLLAREFQRVLKGIFYVLRGR